MKKNMISIILVNFNGKQLTAECIDSIQKHWNRDTYEIIIVDNNSADGSVEYLEQRFSSVRILRLSSNKGFSYANNYGVHQSCGEYLFILNNDTIIENDFSSEMIAALNGNESIGIVAPQLKNPDGTFQLSYWKFPSIRNEYSRQKRHRNDYSRQKRQNESSCSIMAKDESKGNMEWVIGAAMFMRRSIFDAAGGFDEEYFMYYEDTDFCKRVEEMGYAICFDPRISLIHICGGSRGSSVNRRLEIEYRKSQLRYYKRHHKIHQQLLLQLYLFVRYGFQFIVKRSDDSTVAKEILSILSI